MSSLLVQSSSSSISQQILLQPILDWPLPRPCPLPGPSRPPHVFLAGAIILFVYFPADTSAAHPGLAASSTLSAAGTITTTSCLPCWCNHPLRLFPSRYFCSPS